MREAQEYRCFACNGICRGHGWGEPILQVHHVVPASRGGQPTPENAVGLCDHNGEGCHHRFDRLYFREGKTVLEVLLEEGRVYDLRRRDGDRRS